MLGQRFGVDHNVINVCSSELSHVLEDVVHRLLECRCGIAEAERHHQVGKRTVLGSECGSLYMIRVYQNLVEPRMQVELGEELRISNPIKHLINPWKGVLVHHSQPVDGTIVHHHAHLPICLGDKDDLRSEG